MIGQILGAVGGLATTYLDGKVAVQKANAEIKVKQATGEIDWDLAAINATQNSWKDEWITIVYTAILIAHFVPYTQPYMLSGWELLKQANDLFWYSLLAIISGSFGINVLDKFKK